MGASEWSPTSIRATFANSRFNIMCDIFCKLIVPNTCITSVIIVGFLFTYEKMDLGTRRTNSHRFDFENSPTDTLSRHRLDRQNNKLKIKALQSAIIPEIRATSNRNFHLW
jgi:hypothetical protein